VESPQIPRGASVALITPSVSPGVIAAARQLDRRGVQPVLVLLDAHSFGGPAGSRALALAAQKVGLNVRLVSCGADLSAALTSARLEPGLPAAA